MRNLNSQVNYKLFGGWFACSFFFFSVWFTIPPSLPPSPHFTVKEALEKRSKPLVSSQAKACPFCRHTWGTLKPLACCHTQALSKHCLSLAFPDQDRGSIPVDFSFFNLMIILQWLRSAAGGPQGAGSHRPALLLRTALLLFSQLKFTHLSSPIQPTSVTFFKVFLLGPTHCHSPICPFMKSLKFSNRVCLL